MTTVVAYTRASRADDNTDSVDRQEALLRAELARRVPGADLIVITDNDISASRYSRKPRPGFETMLAMVERGEVGAVAAMDVDRLMRKPIDLERLIGVLESTKTDLYLPGETAVLNADGIMVLRIRLAMAAAEADKLSQRKRRAAAHRFNTGKPHVGRRAYGWNLDGSLHIEEAANLRWAVDQVLGGASVYSICAKWNRSGITTAYGKQWSIPSLREILRDDRLQGRLTRAGEESKPGPWEPIVTEEEAEALRAVLTSAPSAPGRKPALLTGILRCTCGAPLVRWGGKDRSHYIHRKDATTGKDPSVRHVAIKVAEADSEAEMMVLEILEARAAQMAEERTGELATLTVEVGKLRDGLTANEVAFRLDEIDARTRNEVRKTLQAKLAPVEARLLDLRSRSLVERIAGRERAAWAEADTEGRRAILRAVVSHIDVMPVGAEIDGRKLASRLVIHPAEGIGEGFWNWMGTDSRLKV